MTLFTRFGSGLYGFVLCALGLGFVVYGGLFPSSVEYLNKGLGLLAWIVYVGLLYVWACSRDKLEAAAKQNH